MIVLKKLSLQDAAVLYCKHGIAGNDAAISCVKTKFHYNLVRPITYIRTVLGHSEWHPVVHTPPFPEYTSAHAAISMACASVLEETFGKNYSHLQIIVLTTPMAHAVSIRLKRMQRKPPCPVYRRIFISLCYG